MGEPGPYRASLIKEEAMMIDSLGCAKVLTANNIVTIYCKFSDISEPLRFALLELLLSTGTIETMYSLIYRPSNIVDDGHVLSSACAAIRSAGYVGTQTLTPALISKRLPLSTIFRADAPLQFERIAEIFEAWKSGNQLSSVGIYNAATAHGSIGRVGLAGYKKGTIIQKFIGRDFNYLSEHERDKFIGAPVANQPDKNFGNWVEAEYSRASESDEPQLSQCSGVVLVNNKPSRRDWFRLILPVRRPKVSNDLVIFSQRRETSEVA